MTFTESISTVFGKYLNAKGRASRSEYWWWTLFTFLAACCVSALELLIGVENEIMVSALNLVLLCPNICVSIRRCHDSGHSGWWVICPIVSLVMMLLPSDAGENEYGEPEC